MFGCDKRKELGLASQLLHPCPRWSRGGSDDDNQSLIWGLLKPLTGPFELPLLVGRTPDLGRPLYSTLIRGQQMSDERPPSPYDAAIEDLRTKREAIDRAIQFLESLRDGTFMSGVSMPTFVFPSGAVGHSGIGSVSTGTTGPEIAPGTFHGMNIETAVKTLLRLRKRTMGAQEIVSDLRGGGLHLQSGTPANTVTSVLTRAFNSGSDIVRVSRGQWGLQEWYPNQRFNRKNVEE